jgi:tRNA wybutosine-synthesizing protein 2
MRRNRAPVERVRQRLAGASDPSVAARLPRGYTRLGPVVLLRLPGELAPQFARLGRLYAEELGARTVLRATGPVLGEYRRPSVEVLYGSDTETEVLEHGVRWRFDAAEIMFARGNKGERARAAELVGPGERVVDLFAGIGYFAVPAARRQPSARITAVEANPVAFRYLAMNCRRNGVADRVRCLLGDNRRLALDRGRADRVFLGYLPSSLPWTELALGLLRAEGGVLHLHFVADVRDGLEGAAALAAAAVGNAGGRLDAIAVREVKPYGPGRFHAVADVRAVPP